MSTVTAKPEENVIQAYQDLQQNEGWLPTGQLILKHGFEKMTPEQAYVKILGEANHCGAKAYNDKCRGCDGHKIEGSKKPGFYTLRCGWKPEECSLSRFRNEPIPQESLEQIRLAHCIGLTNMYVFWMRPLTDKERRYDPIVLAYWDNEWWFVTSWD